VSKRRQAAIQAGIVRRSQSRNTSFSEAGKPSRNAWVGARSAGRHEFGHHRATIGDENVLTGLDRAHNLAEAILELANTHRLHFVNVAPCGHFVKLDSELNDVGGDPDDRPNRDARP